MWKCQACGALVVDEESICGLCGEKSLDFDETNTAQLKRVDDEGLTAEDRNRRRPAREVANYMRRQRQRSKKKRSQFTDAVVPGSVKTSRPLFSTFK